MSYDKWLYLSKRLDNLENKLIGLIESHQQVHMSATDKTLVALTEHYQTVNEMMKKLTAQLNQVNQVREQLQQETMELKQKTRDSIDKIDRLYQSREQELTQVYQQHSHITTSTSNALQQKIIEEKLGNSISAWLRNREQEQGNGGALETIDLELLKSLIENQDGDPESLSPRQQEILNSINHEENFTDTRDTSIDKK